MRLIPNNIEIREHLRIIFKAVVYFILYLAVAVILGVYILDRFQLMKFLPVMILLEFVLGLFMLIKFIIKT